VDFLGVDTILMKASEYRRLQNSPPFSRYHLARTFSFEEDMAVLHNPDALPVMRLYPPDHVNPALVGETFEGLTPANFRDELFIAGWNRPSPHLLGADWTQSRADILEVKGNWAVARTHAAGMGAWLAITDYHHDGWRARVDGR